MLNFVEFKSASIHMHEELQENICRQFRERMRMHHQMKNTDKGMESIRKTKLKSHSLKHNN